MKLNLIILVLVCVGIVFYLKSKSKTYPIFSRIRIEKPKGEALHLAEVQAFSPSNVNVALLGTASQSTTRFAKAQASNANNGITEGDWGKRQITHTNGQMKNDNFWEVEFIKPSQLASIKVFNRTDCCSDKLANATLIGFDEKSEVILEKSLTGDIVQEFKL